jgi:hypothetical protein
MYFRKLTAGVLLWAAAIPLRAQTLSPKLKSFFPPLLLCEKNKNILVRDIHGKTDWEYSLQGPLWDVQPQPSGRYLVTGGSQKVFLLRKVWKGFRVLWDWSQLDGIDVESAVAADWGLDGNPSLILAADRGNQRIFLAEAKSKGIKIRWEYKLAAIPLRVHLCPDSGNFLVVLKDSAVEEIEFQEDKLAWSLGKENGLHDVRDAVRDPWAHTYVVDAWEKGVLCFDSDKNLVWKTKLPFIGSNGVENMSLALFKKNGKRILMAAVHLSGEGSLSPDVIYLLNTDTGKVLERPSREGLLSGLQQGRSGLSGLSEEGMREAISKPTTGAQRHSPAV